MVAGAWVSGCVLARNGTPLARVAVVVGDATAQTGGDGRFALGPLPPGRHILVVDGATVDQEGARHGVFEIGVTLAEGERFTLPYPIWMPQIDTAHAVRVSSPTPEDITITHPDLPGLEVRIPAGSTIRDRLGRPVEEISITPVPLDRPPFPMPYGAEFPIYFTVQPGGAEIAPYGAQVIYPNVTRARPGTRITYWYYEPSTGWRPYGKGTVSDDRARVLPDPEVAIPRLTAFSIKPFPDGPNPCGADDDGDPISLGTGLFVLEETDLLLVDTIPIALRRSYRPELAFRLRPFGRGSTHPYEVFLYPDATFSEIDLILPDGGRVHYRRTSLGTGREGAVFDHRESPSIFFASTIAAVDRDWELTLRDGTTYSFAGIVPLLQGIRDRHGNRVAITRERGEHGVIQTIHSPNGRWLKFTYAGHRNVASVEDNLGRIVRYGYDDEGVLTSVTNPAGQVTRYAYDASFRMITIADGAGNVLLANQYDDEGRVIKQTLVDGSVHTFAYTADDSGRIVQTDVTNPRGVTRRMTFGQSGYVTTDTHAFGTPEAQTTTYERDPASNLLLRETDALGRQTVYAYDDAGDVTSITFAADTPDAATLRFRYEPRFHLMDRITDPLGHHVLIERDDRGNIIRLVDQLGKKTTFEYDHDGRVTSVKDAVGNVTRFGHEPDDYALVTDPLGRVFRRFLDGAGRAVLARDAQGRSARYDWDLLDQLTRVTNPDRTVLQYGYERGNLTDFTDPRGSVTRFSYDARGRVTTLADPLGGEEHHAYDGMSNLVQHIDRKGQSLRFEYDVHNRPTRVAFADGAIASYRWDAASRLIEATDESGTIRSTYDALDRLVTEETPRGKVTYAWDSGSRRTTMSTSEGQTLLYTWDAGNRLIAVDDGSRRVRFEYDAVGRRRIVRFDVDTECSYSYAFDRASRISKLSYRRGNSLVGSLRYSYDASGNVRRLRGSFARTSIPEPVAEVAYDHANRIVSWGSMTPTHDANGNLTSDGVHSYAWDARDRLIAVDGEGGPSSFEYDALDRRIRTTLRGVRTEYLHDGVNPIRMSSDGNVTSLLVGPRIDDHLIRIVGDEVLCFLPDALGSTIALMRTDGAIVEAYSYEPFGLVTTVPAEQRNPFQHIGRENDDTGLHYLRSRYYSPRLHRFISEDPIGLSGGVNVYAYVANNPLTWIDPHGLHCSSPGGAGTSIGGGGAMGFGAGLNYALKHQNRTSPAGQAKLGKPGVKPPYYWDRSFHFDGPHGPATRPHLNAEFGPLRGLNHRPIPNWLYRSGSTRALGAIAHGTMVVGFALDAYRVITAGPGERGAALGGMLGGFGGAHLGAVIGGMLLPGVGAVIGGLLGGALGGWGGHWLGGMLFPCIP